MASTNVFLLHHSYFSNSNVSYEAGQEGNNFIDDLLATLQTYQMEFDAHCVCIATFLPVLFLYLIGNLPCIYSCLIFFLCLELRVLC
jgi:hypothetical protein